MAVDQNFLPSLLQFTSDMMTDETMELLQPYLSIPIFNVEDAQKSSNAAAGLCGWVVGMATYYQTYKQLRPKMDELRIQKSRLEAASAKLEIAESELSSYEEELLRLKSQFDTATTQRQQMQDIVEISRKQMDHANKLLDVLLKDKVWELNEYVFQCLQARWSSQVERFSAARKNLVGDVAQMSAFITYCGPLNEELRRRLLDTFKQQCTTKSIPCTQYPVSTIAQPYPPHLNLLADESTIFDWKLRGLPNDQHSIESAVIVMRQPQWPLLVDPEQQAIVWLQQELRSTGIITSPADDDFATQVEIAVSTGRPLLVHDMQTIPPILHTIVRKVVTVTLQGEQRIRLDDHEIEYVPTFRMYMVTSMHLDTLPTDLTAHAAVVTFTLTTASLEDILLSKLIGIEKPAQDRERREVLSGISSMKQALDNLEKLMISSLCEKKQGCLLDDATLIDTLTAVKSQNQEGMQFIVRCYSLLTVIARAKLQQLQSREKELSDTRNQYRDVAVRGATVFLAVAEMRAISSAYILSLDRFFPLLEKALKDVPRVSAIDRRVNNLIEYLTFHVYSVAIQGMFERHRSIFSLLFAFRIQLHAQRCKLEELKAFIMGGAGIDVTRIRRKPAEWFPNQSWYNIMAVSAAAVDSIREIAEHISKNDQHWKQWMESDQPETMSLPDALDLRLTQFQRLLIIRCLRPDRLQAAINEYVNQVLGKRYTEPQNIDWDAILSQTVSNRPVLCLLASASDPSNEIETLAVRQHKQIRIIAMGEGISQEQIMQSLHNAATTGQWILLQNGHLMPHVLSLIDNFFCAFPNFAREDFRLWLTVAVHPQIPPALLRKSIKIATDIPNGLKASMSRTLTWLSNEGLVNCLESQAWRNSVFGFAFFHCVLQERCRFGTAGWVIPYEFSFSDLRTSLMFLRNHIKFQEQLHKQRGSRMIVWSTVRAMVTEVLYGSHVTNNYDKAVLQTYCSRWLTDGLTRQGYMFHEQYRIASAGDLQSMLASVSQFPSEDLPELFGIFASTAITSHTVQSTELLRALSPLFPSTATSSDSLVPKQIDEITSKLPHHLLDHEKLLEKLDKIGARRPLSVFLRSEYERLQTAVTNIRKTLLVCNVLSMWYF